MKAEFENGCGSGRGAEIRREGSWKGAIVPPPPAFTALAYIPFKLHVAVTQFQPFLITLE